MTMRNILYVVSDFNSEISLNYKNLGDLLVLEGAKHLLRHTYGEHNVILFDKYLAYNNDDYYKFFDIRDIDLLAVVGSPWLHNFDTQKYKVLGRLMNQLKNVEKIAVGIGSAISLNEDIKYSKSWDIWRRFDRIIVRDYTASKILGKLNIDTLTGFCPSYFYKYVIDWPMKTEEYNLLVYYNPYTGICDKLSKKYKDKMIKFQKDFNADVTISTQDYENEPGILRVRTLKELVKIISRAERVLSGRVHPMVLSMLLHKKCALIPVDTRMEIVTRGGGKIISPYLNEYKFSTASNWLDTVINNDFLTQSRYLLEG